jgi:flagellar hook-associated protein 2
MSNISPVRNMRMTGLASGLDVEDMVKKMLSSQQSRVDKAKQQKNLINWRKDAYRSVINRMSDFQGKFLDILSPSSIIRAGQFKNASASVPPGMAQFMSASGTSASSAPVTVNSISQLASSQRLEGADGHRLAGEISMNVNADRIAAALGQSVNFTLNGETRSITLERDIEKYRTDGEFDINKLVGDMNDKLARAFGMQDGQPKVSVGFRNGAAGNALTVNAAPNNTLRVSGSGEARNALGFTNNAANYIDTGRTINQVLGNVRAASDGKIRFGINDVAFTFDPGASMNDVMSEINKSDAGVTITYSSFSDQFIITAKETGSGDNIRLSQSMRVMSGSGEVSEVTTNFFDLMFGAGAGGAIGKNTAGENAVLTVNGVEIVRSSNTVIVDGVTLNLIQATPAGFINNEPIRIAADSDQIIENIKSFIQEYNDLVKSLSEMLNTRRPRSSGSFYMPLTDEQKSAMSDRDIESWEETGKRGLLYGDPAISRILGSLRSAVTGVVQTENGAMSLASIGIRTASFFEDASGKLIVDEDALRQAIENDPDAVMNLFTQTSNISRDAEMGDVFSKDANGRYYTTDSNGNKRLVSERDLRNMRSGSTGIAQQFAEIFNSAINVTVNPRERGALILRAGTGGSNVLIDSESSMQRQLSNLERSVERMQDKLAATESKYYKRFASLETALARLSRQSSFFMGAEQ